LGTFTKGAPLSKADISDTGNPFILYGELYTTYPEITTSIVRKTLKTATPECLSRVGDVIIPTSGETPEEIATATCVMLSNVILAGDLNIYRNSIVDGRFISYIINHVVNGDISRIAQGKSVVHIKADELSKIVIHYPERAEQQKIIDFLYLLDTQIAKQRQMIDMLKSYKRGLYNHIFHSKTNQFEKHKLSDFARVYGGYAFDSKTYVPNGLYKVITIGNVTGARYVDLTDTKFMDHIPFDLQRYQRLVIGDIIISMTGNVGRTSIVNKENCLLNQRVAKLDFYNPNYKELIFQILSCDNFTLQMEQQGQGAAQKNIKNSDIENYEFYAPTSLSECKNVALLLSSVDAIIESELHKQRLLSILKSALLQQLFI